MLPQIELFCVGFAAVVDTVLLLVVLERVNRPLTAIWLKWSLTGATLWHVGSFLHTLLRETEGATAAWLDAMCMVPMACGLLLLSCGILHAGLRISKSGISQSGALTHPQRDLRYGAVYVPLLFMAAVAVTIVRSGSRDFIQATQAFHLPYLFWLTFANLTSAGLLIHSRNRFIEHTRPVRRFLLRFALGVIGVTVLANYYVLSTHTLRSEPILRLLTNLSPIVPTLTFAYYIFRRRLLPMVFERTLVYGAILLAVFYLHRLTLSPLMSKYSQQFEFDFVVVEGLLLVALVLAYQPLRDRFREGLRYLIGGDVTQIRDATRLLSVELSRRSGDDITDISNWFADGIVRAMSLRYCVLAVGDQHNVRRPEAQSAETLSERLTPAAIRESITQLSVDKTDRWIDRSRCNDAQQLAVMQELDAIAVFRINYQNITGCLLLGVPRTGDRLSDEQLNTISLLVDQYAATVHNRQLAEARRTAERRAVQQEKLSTLGLLSGSLAHELRNPLSSMRTIATLLGEDLGPNSEQAKDVQLIVSEIDRLTQTTQRLLEFARPPDTASVGVAPDAVIERLMHILSHLARQHGVKVVLSLELGDTLVRATDAVLCEILLNLIKNAIEAVRETEQPEVRIVTHESVNSDGNVVMISISDNGPGIIEDMRDHIFEPFVTGKADGTGLGLYLVGERVREIAGNIDCSTMPGQTTFEVTLPMVTPQIVHH
jgi:signal transduction histidine kinase